MTTTTKPEFIARRTPFSGQFLPLNEEALKLCNLAKRSYLSAEEVKTLVLFGIEVSYHEEEENGSTSKSS